MMARWHRPWLPFALVVLAGCASTKVTQKSPPASPELARPQVIWVHDFIADPAAMPADSAIRSSVSAPSTRLSPSELATGRQLGAMIAQYLVDDLNSMGMAARRAGTRAPGIGDGVIRGYLVSVSGGSGVKRVTIGFGSGASELDTVVETYVQTKDGLRKVGQGSVTSTSGKTSGAVAPAVVALATANPVGLIVVGGTKVYGEATGKSALEGRAKATADAIAKELRTGFRKRGWIK